MRIAAVTIRPQFSDSVGVGGHAVRRRALFQSIRNFFDDTDGAVTVDWVVLTAAIVALAITVLFAIGGSSRDLATDIANEIDGIDIGTY